MTSNTKLNSVKYKLPRYIIAQAACMTNNNEIFPWLTSNSSLQFGQ